jgi:hypothetical protein
MSQENVEIVQRLMEAFERRDPEATFAILDATSSRTRATSLMTR